MEPKRLVMPALAAALALAPVQRAGADAGDFVAGAAVGVLGTLAVQEANRNRQRQTTVVRRAPAGIPATERGANTQTALNYFGYDAGRVDGQVGPATRAAIERYQASMGYPVNGRDFPDDQYATLMSAYQWAQSGGESDTGLAGQPLLMAYRDLQAGKTAAAAAEQTEPLQPATQASGAALPNFMASGGGESLASHCNAVSLLTTTNGGFATAATMSDPESALDEQFCLARTYAIAAGEDLAAGVQGVSADEIEAQCAGFGPVMASHVGALSMKPMDAVLEEVGDFVLDSGIAPAQLAGTAKICLSVGYRTDDMDVALGSALILAALGEEAYGELMGHHLYHGFGATKRTDLALAWYDLGLEAAARGAAVFAPGQPERLDVIRAATRGIAGQDAVVPAASGAGGLPAFSVQQ